MINYGGGFLPYFIKSFIYYRFVLKYVVKAVIVSLNIKHLNIKFHFCVINKSFVTFYCLLYIQKVFIMLRFSVEILVKSSNIESKSSY